MQKIVSKSEKIFPNKIGISEAEYNLLKAKENLLKISETYEPLGIIRRYPFSSISCAFLVGFCMERLRSKDSINTILPGLFDFGILAMRIVLKLYK